MKFRGPFAEQSESPLLHVRVEERVRVRRLRQWAARVFANPDLLTLTLSSTQTWRRGEQRGLAPQTALCFMARNHGMRAHCG